MTLRTLTATRTPRLTRATVDYATARINGAPQVWGVVGDEEDTSDEPTVDTRDPEIQGEYARVLRYLASHHEGGTAVMG